MTTTSTTKIDLAKRLFDAIQARKQAEKLEAALKSEIKLVMGDETTMVADGIEITREEASRSGIDGDLLTEKMGEAFVLGFIKTTTFEKLSVKKV